MNTNIEPVIVANALRVLSGLRTSNHIKHPGVKGDIRELLFSAAVRPWLGPMVEWGTGHIVNAYGDEGIAPPQIDVVLYFPGIHTPIHFGDPTAPAYFPVESVAAAVEVKSAIDSAPALDEALAHLEKLNPVFHRYQPGTMMDNNGRRHPQPQPTRDPFRVVFGFSSDIKNQSTFEPVLKLRAYWDAVCILGVGHWVRLRTGEVAEIVDPAQPHQSHPDLGSARQIVSFASIFSDNIKDIRMSRGSPGLQSYVLSDPINSCVRKLT